MTFSDRLDRHRSWHDGPCGCSVWVQLVGGIPEPVLRLDTLLSIVTIASMYLVSEGKPVGWLVAFIGQFLWMAYVIRRRAWGLAPLTIFMTLVYLNGLMKWMALRG